MKDKQPDVRINALLVNWAPGSENMAEYHTKHHHPIYHRCICAKHVQDTQPDVRINALLRIESIIYYATPLILLYIASVTTVSFIAGGVGGNANIY